MSEITILNIDFKVGEEINTIYPVILHDKNEMILIDCGYPNFVDFIEKEALKKGVDMRNLSKIIITHHDFDHMGSLADFKRKYPKIKVLASREEESYINGSEKSLRLQQAEGIYKLLPESEKEKAQEFHKMLEAVEGCNVDIVVKDRDYFDLCGGVEVIATPGHMPGHISIYHKESKSLIVGDALVIENGELAIALPQYTLDINKARGSIKKFLSYDIDKVICYHGGIYNNDIVNALKKI